MSSASISSSVFPFVSGSTNQSTTNPIAHITPYNQKLFAHPRFSLIAGKEKVSVKFPIHKDVAAIDMAAPRMRFGNISASITQTMGARVREYKSNIGQG